MLTEYLNLYEKNVDEKTKKQIAYAAEEFESEKKVLIINELEAQAKVKELTLKKRNLWLFGLSSLTALIIVAFFAMYRNTQQKKKILLREAELNEQKIKELEKEKLLVATRAVMQGEEKERTRLARDLHDSLGGMLSGIKLKISNAMKGNVVLPEDLAIQFENTLGLLDSTIGELRHIANNLMPESLLKFGLKSSLTDFCNRFNEKEKELVIFQFYGEDQRFESEIEIAVFRIAQELISNSLKHSEATKIEVQVIVDESRICLQVMDNGVGFVNETAIKKGRGLKNIENRVAALNGQIETQSRPGKGTETMVEFGLTKS
jgi:signal transduction histidine kinase